MRSNLASGAARTPTPTYSQIVTIAALARAGFDRYATYRQATAASIATNSVFGFLRCSVLLAVAAGVASDATAASGDGAHTPAVLTAGYQASQLATYCWLGQGLIGVVMIWGWTDLSDRIRSGDVVADLLRPLHPVTSYLSVDLGRAAFAGLTRFVAPMLIGAAFFDLHRPQRPATYPLFVLSVLLGVVISFCCRFLVNVAGYWLLEIRGVMLLHMFAATALSGLAFPLHFLPSWLGRLIWLATPFPSILQAPLDVGVEYGTLGHSLAMIALQAAWAIAGIAGCRLLHVLATRRLVIQGG